MVAGIIAYRDQKIREQHKESDVGLMYRLG